MKKPRRKPRTTHGPRIDNRRPAVLLAAAARFARQGFDGVSMNDIAKDAGMLKGSLYYHFPNKDALARATHEEGVRRIVAAMREAVLGKRGPWQRLEAACVAHLQELLDGGDFAAVVTQCFAQASPGLRRKLIPQRNLYEKLFGALVNALPLRAEVDKRLLRLHLLGALNWAPVWYRAGKKSKPDAIARQIVAAIKTGVAR